MRLVALDDPFEPEAFLVTCRVVLEETDKLQSSPESYALNKLQAALFDYTGYIPIPTTECFTQQLGTGPLNLHREDGTIARKIEDLRYEVYEASLKKKVKKKVKLKKRKTLKSKKK